MAFTTTCTLFGMDFPNAYHRVTDVRCNKNTGICVVLEVYPDQDASASAVNACATKVHDFAFTTSLDGLNPIEQGYNLLKTLPEYSTASDA